MDSTTIIEALRMRLQYERENEQAACFDSEHYAAGGKVAIIEELLGALENDDAAALMAFSGAPGSYDYFLLKKQENQP